MTPVDLTDLQGQGNLVYLCLYNNILQAAFICYIYVGIFHLSSTLCPAILRCCCEQMILIRGSLGLPEGGIVVYHQATFLHQASGHQG